MNALRVVAGAVFVIAACLLALFAAGVFATADKEGFLYVYVAGVLFIAAVCGLIARRLFQGQHGT